MDFYYMNLSAPCRGVMLTAKAAGVTLNKKVLNLFEKEQMKEEFIAINPQHVIPTLVDGDIKLWESRAICMYIATKYGNDAQYSKDPNERAQIDRLLFFDMGTMYQRYGEYVYPVAFRGQETPDPEKLQRLQEALGFFNAELEGHDFAVGNRITIADNCLVASISTIQETGIDISAYPNITKWIARCKEQMPGYQAENAEGAAECGAMMKSKGKF